MILPTAEDFSLLLFTLKVAAVSTLIIAPIGILTAHALSRWRSPLKGLVETFLSMPLVLPPTAVGILLLELIGRYGILGGILARMGIAIAFTWKAVVLATAVMSFPLLIRPTRAAFEEIDPRLVGIARTLGTGPVGVFFRVTVPLAWRGISTGMLLAFSRSLGEFGATILVAGNIPGRSQTLALAIFERTEMGDDAAAMRLVAITVLIAFVAVWLTELITRRRTRQFAG